MVRKISSSKCKFLCKCNNLISHYKIIICDVHLKINVMRRCKNSQARTYRKRGVFSGVFSGYGGNEACSAIQPAWFINMSTSMYSKPIYLRRAST